MAARLERERGGGGRAAAPPPTQPLTPPTIRTSDPARSQREGQREKFQAILNRHVNSKLYGLDGDQPGEGWLLGPPYMLGEGGGGID